MTYYKALQYYYQGFLVPTLALVMFPEKHCGLRTRLHRLNVDMIRLVMHMLTGRRA